MIVLLCHIGATMIHWYHGLILAAAAGGVMACGE